jgi:hypothetical protein
VVADHPGYTGTYYHLGKLYEALNRKDDAIEDLRNRHENNAKEKPGIIMQGPKDFFEHFSFFYGYLFSEKMNLSYNFYYLINT